MCNCGVIVGGSCFQLTVMVILTLLLMCGVCRLRCMCVVAQLTVMGQASALSGQGISYRPPSISQASPSAISTDGGDVTLSGLNFGADLSKVSIVVDGTAARSFGFEVRFLQSLCLVYGRRRSSSRILM